MLSVYQGWLPPAHETPYKPDDIRVLADRIYHPRDIRAAVSSGSFVTAGMLVAPCSVKTLSGIPNSYNENLVVRATDVCLKERRRICGTPPGSRPVRNDRLDAGHCRSGRAAGGRTVMGYAEF